jgi:flagellin-like protein
VSTTTIIIIILIVLLVAGLPTWGYSRRWRGGRGYGYAPSGVLGLILLIVIILWLAGRL